MNEQELRDLLTEYTQAVETLIRERGYHRGTVLHILATHSTALLLDLMSQEPPQQAVTEGDLSGSES